MKDSTLQGLQEVGLLIIPFMLCIDILTVPTMSIALLSSAAAGAPVATLFIMAILIIPSLVNTFRLLREIISKFDVIKSIRKGIFFEEMVENNIHANPESTWLTTLRSVTIVPFIITYFIFLGIEGKFVYLALIMQLIYACGVVIPLAISSAATWLLKHKKA